MGSLVEYWKQDLDLNQKRQVMNLVCCLYTILQ
jgi:hypothetical protein